MPSVKFTKDDVIKSYDYNLGWHIGELENEGAWESVKYFSEHYYNIVDVAIQPSVISVFVNRTIRKTSESSRKDVAIEILNYAFDLDKYLYSTDYYQFENAVTVVGNRIDVDLSSGIQLTLNKFN